jgi:hypothetical protein
MFSSRAEAALCVNTVCCCPPTVAVDQAAPACNAIVAANSGYVVLQVVGYNFGTSLQYINVTLTTGGGRCVFCHMHV